MSLPVYEHINLKSSSIEELSHLMVRNLNLHHPIVINLKALDLDQQREAISLIEHFYVSQNISFKFPYPIYLVSNHERSISKFPLVLEVSELPKFFTQRESKMNVKESQLSGKNRLLQQEVNNSDSSTNAKDIENYRDSHKIIFGLEKERVFYLSILNRLVTENKDG